MTLAERTLTPGAAPSVDIAGEPSAATPSTRSTPFHRPPTWLLLGILATAVSVLRVPRLWAGYWGDEALSVGIASHPLAAIPRYLRFDGSPPLYYFVLHGWMRLFGTSEVATHSLSLLIAAACVPVGWWCGRVLFGRPAAWGAAVLLAVSSYLTTYGAETRMYALLALLGLLAVTCWVMTLRAGDRRYLAGAVTASALTLYTHNWGLYLVAAMALTGMATAARVPWRRRLVAFYVAVVGLSYLPWVPSFVHQLGHTGAPWSPRPTLGRLWADPLNLAAGGAWPVLLAAIIVGLGAAVWQRRWGRSDSGRHSGPNGPVRPPGRRGPLSATFAFVIVVCAVTVVGGWLGGQVVQSWAPRYLGVALVPALVVVGALLVTSRIGRISLAVLSLTCVVSAAWLLGAPPGHLAYAKSNAAWSVGAFEPSLEPGDVVISAQVSQLPLVTFYTPRAKGLQYATPLGPVSDPMVVNWNDLARRLATAQPASALAPLLAALPVGAHVLLVKPLKWQPVSGADTYGRSVRDQGIAATRVVVDDPHLALLATRALPPGSRPTNPVMALLLVKVSGA